MAKAAGEMSHWPEYDYVIVNREKAEAFAEVRAILAAERVRRERQIGLSDFVRVAAGATVTEARADRNAVRPACASRSAVPLREI